MANIKSGSTYSSNPERRYVKRAKESTSGKDIDEGFEEVNSKIDNVIAGVYKFKGSVATYSDLPTTGLEVGYTYNVNDTGKNYAWDGTNWDDIGGIAKIIVDDIEALTNDQCESLQCGDIVIKQTGEQLHSYRVSYKEHHVGMCLTYTDASCSETVSYDYTTAWAYNSKDVKSFEGLVPVVANPTIVGTESNLDGIEIDGVKYKAGGGEQANWTETDSSSPSYIKNKPEKRYVHQCTVWVSDSYRSPTSGYKVIQTRLAPFILISPDSTPYPATGTQATQLNQQLNRTPATIVGTVPVIEISTGKVGFMNVYDNINRVSTNISEKTLNMAAVFANDDGTSRVVWVNVDVETSGSKIMGTVYTAN